MLGEKSYNFSLTNWPQSNLVLNSQHLVSQLGHLKTIIAVFPLDGKVCSLKSELLRSRTPVCMFFKVFLHQIIFFFVLELICNCVYSLLLCVQFILELIQKPIYLNGASHELRALCAIVLELICNCVFL